MNEIVKLGKVRKTRAKAAAERLAAENRVRHGRTKAEKQADQRAEQRRQILLDQTRREEE